MRGSENDWENDGPERKLEPMEGAADKQHKESRHGALVLIWRVLASATPDLSREAARSMKGRTLNFRERIGHPEPCNVATW